MWTKNYSSGSAIYQVDELDKTEYRSYTLTSDIEISNLTDNDEYSVRLYDKVYAIRKRILNLDPYTLPSGCYKYNPGRYGLVPIVLNEEEQILKFESEAKVLDDYRKFRESENLYRKLKLIYKRGILLFGPPGTGKSTLIKNIVLSSKNNDYVALWLPQVLDTDIINALKLDPRPKILILEELVQFTGHSMGRLLTLLDGEDSLDNTYIIAATNHPEKIPENLINRPGRFDEVVEIDKITLNDIKLYAAKFGILELSEAEVKELKTCTLAELKELFLIALRDKKPILDIMAKIKLNRELYNKAFSKQKPMGFLDEDDI